MVIKVIEYWILPPLLAGRPTRTGHTLVSSDCDAEVLFCTVANHVSETVAESWLALYWMCKVGCQDSRLRAG